MATLKLTIGGYQSKKNGGWSIKVALCHKSSTSYIATGYVVDDPSQFKNGCVVHHPQASLLNIKLSGLLNNYREALLELNGVECFSPTQLRSILLNRTKKETMEPTFQFVAKSYIDELVDEGRTSYARLLESVLS